MSERDNGGHAFPNITPDMMVDGGPGMSLRDYFAAKAMHALIGRGTCDGEREILVSSAYQIADAMLKERAK